MQDKTMNTSGSSPVPNNEENGSKPNFSLAKNRLASNPGTAPETLEKLTRKQESGVVERVAENPQTAPETLEKLSTHESADVRSAVSENTNTPEETVAELAKDNDPDVRFRVAENPNTPTELLHNLSQDENPFVAARAKDTLNASRSLVHRADDLFLKDNFAEAEVLYGELVNKLTELLGEDHREVALALHKLAATKKGQGKAEEADQLANKATIILGANEEKAGPMVTD